jgi:hypothetical protein
VSLHFKLVIACNSALPKGEERCRHFKDHRGDLKHRRLAHSSPRDSPRHPAKKQRQRDKADQRAVAFYGGHHPPNEEADQQVNAGEIAKLIVELRHDGVCGEKTPRAEDDAGEAEKERDEAEDEECDLEGFAHVRRIGVMGFELQLVFWGEGM